MINNINEININDIKNNFQMIHYFGLGFIQLKINDEYRLHFYTDKLPKILEEEEVHNHRYDFISKILHGNFEQKIFEIINGDDYNLENESCNENMKAPKDVKKVSIKLICSQSFSKGSSYKLDKDTFHRVYSNNCITLLKRDKPSKEFAQVLTPKNAKKICAFSKKIDEKILWEIVEEMLNKAKEETN